MESRASTVEPGNLTIFAHAEEELIQFKTIADCANYGIAISNLEGNLTYVNECFAKMHGYSRDEFIGKHLFIFHAEEQLDSVKTLITQLIHTGNFVNQEVWHKRKDGTTFPTLMSATVIKSKEGKPQFLSTTALDLTELKKSERETKEAREFLESIFRTSVDGIIVTDPKGYITMVNEAVEKMLGYSKGELIGKHGIDLTPRGETNDEKTKKFVSQLSEKDIVTAFEHTWLRKDGSLIDFEINVALLRDKAGNNTGAVGTIRDITNRKRAENELKKKERELALINKIATIFLTVSTSEMYKKVLKTILEVTESTHGFFGYINEEGVLLCPAIDSDIWDNTPMKNRFVSFTRDQWTGSWGKALITKQSLYVNKNLRLPDGHFPILRTLVTPIIHQGEAVGIFTVADKLTDYDEHDKKLLETLASYMAPILYVRLQSDRKERERRFIEHELKEINEHLDNIIESSLDCIMVTDSTGKISRANKSFQKLLGREEEEIVGKHMSYFLPPDKKIYESTSGKPIDINEDFLIEVKAKIATFLKEGTLYNWETCFTRHDKKLIPIEANLSILRDDKQTVVGGVAILRDISDRRHGEEMLKRVNQCLLSFSPDSDENIKNILETAGLVLGSICTLYNREDGPFLCTVEGWNIPKDLKRKDRKEGHICYDIMTKFKRDEPCIINDLDRSPYATTDPNVAKYKLKTYVGCVVKKNTQIIGTLCVVYQEHKTLSANELNILSILAKAVGIEEERKEAFRTLQEHQQRLIISEENLREFSRKILSVREEEKKRLSRSLHDEIGSMTIALGSHLSITEEEITDHNLERALENLAHTKTALAQSVQRLKKLCIDLRPPALDIAGLPNILKKHCAAISKHEGIPIEFRVDGNETQLSDEVVTVLYRITQEALNNVIQHARAKKVTADLHFQGEAIKLTIKDDGKGFEVEKKLKKSKGLGLIGMRERIESVGGVFTITSAIKKGTEITVSLRH